MFCSTLQGFDTVLSDMLHFTSGVNDVELSLELAGTAMNVATGHYYDLYGEAFEQQVILITLSHQEIASTPSEW
jgi:hypothetical protein